MKMKGKWEFHSSSGLYLRGYNLETTVGLAKLANVIAFGTPGAMTMQFGDSPNPPLAEQIALQGTLLGTFVASPTVVDATVQLDAQPSFASNFVLRECGIFFSTVLISRFVLPNIEVVTGEVYTTTWLLPLTAG